jgi:hypothetical protein
MFWVFRRGYSVAAPPEGISRFSSSDCYLCTGQAPRGRNEDGFSATTNSRGLASACAAERVHRITYSSVYRVFRNLCAERSNEVCISMSRDIEECETQHPLDSKLGRLTRDGCQELHVTQTRGVPLNTKERNYIPVPGMRVGDG